MNTKTYNYIPVLEKNLDPYNRAQVTALIEAVEAKFKLAAKAWEQDNNSGSGDLLERMEARCDLLQRKAELLLAPLGIKCSYPGLYPYFNVSGHFEYSTEAAVLAALGHPRNWLQA